ANMDNGWIMVLTYTVWIHSIIARPARPVNKFVGDGVSGHIRNGVPEAGQREAEEDRANHHDSQELGPYHLETRPPEENGLGEGDKVGGRSRAHQPLDHVR